MIETESQVINVKTCLEDRIEVCSQNHQGGREIYMLGKIPINKELIS